MRAAKILGVLIALVGALYVLRSTFLSALGESPRAAAPPAVLFSAPPGTTVEEAGAIPRAEAARRLAKAVGAVGVAHSRAVHFTENGYEIYWLVDAGRKAPLVERVAGPSGTRRETEYRGDVLARLAWAAEHGTLDTPGLPAGESRNLYH